MPVHRCSTPPFHEYVCKRAIADAAGNLPAVVSTLNVTAIRIPSFQRGISWGEEEVTKLLNSESVLFGNVVVGMFQNAPAVLIDGLQRFATGTALLHLLYDRVLSAAPNNIGAAAHFTRLRAHVQHMQPVYAHNHAQFESHPRNAIRNQYEVMYRELTQLVDDFLLPQNVVAAAAQINGCMLDKQIAIDEYWNFGTDVELANTFVGLNTVRVELGPVDLIRAYIVDRATAAAPPWSPQDISQVENDVTETFIRDDGKPRAELVPTTTVVLKCMQGKSQMNPGMIFSGWAALTQGEVDRFLVFMDRMLAVQNPYLREIRECGHLPFAIVILFYYRQYVQTGNEPAFFQPNATGLNADLHTLLRAMYRVLLEGRVGRLGHIAENVVRGSYLTLQAVADAVAAETSAGILTTAPQTDWLRACLVQADMKRAKRVFNACLLPDRNQPGSPFSPLIFGRSAAQWQIDHLLPDANLQRNQAGYLEGDSLRNYAPLPQPVNRANSNTPCSQKLAAGGPYDICLQNPAQAHSYLSWLVQNQAAHGASLDNQSKLEPNAVPPVGDERIAQLVSLLTPKI